MEYELIAACPRALGISKLHVLYILNIKSVYYRHFRLHLWTARGLFSKNFQAFAVNKHTQSEAVHIDTKDFYEGYIDGRWNK